ncbi:MAG TPA: serine/threonine-protein kinase [Ktedonosporobacter sp.]|nr:serine/threonine-protein kinase [Ktedonosporobacter sp.]
MSTSLVFCDHCGAANEDPTSSCFACHRLLALEEMPSAIQATSATYLHAGRYRILSTLGHGGYSAVYKAADTRWHDHLVAIKAVNLRGLRPDEIIDATETFNRELALLSNLCHPNLPRLHEHFSDAEHWYLVMDFIEGETLEEYIQTRNGRLPFTEVLKIGMRLCPVLDYLHTLQPPVIFRDVKPANIMRDPRGRLYLIDFGIARRLRPGMRRDTSLLGSPGYAAPEQYGRAQTSPQTDIYGLGITLWQLLSGEDPATTAITGESIATSFLAPSTSNSFKGLLIHMLNPDPTLRPKSVREVNERLQRELDIQYVRGYAPLLPTGLQSSTPPSSFSPGTSTSFGGTAYYTPPGARLAAQQQYYAPSVGQPQRSRKHTITRRKAIVGITGALVAIGGGASLIHSMTAASPADMTYTGHKSEVHAVAWAPDGQRIASGDKQGIVHIWEASTGNTLLTYQAWQIVSGAVNSLSWSSNSQLLVAGYENAVIVWDLSQSLPTFVWQNICGPTDLSPDGNYIAALGRNSTDTPAIVILKAINGESNNPPLSIGSTSLKALAWSPQSNQLAIITNDSIMNQIWNLPGAAVVPAGSGPSNLAVFQGLRSVAWSLTSATIAIGDDAGLVQTYAMLNGSLSDEFTVQPPVYALAWSPMNSWGLCAADASGILTVSTMNSGHKTIKTGDQPLFGISWSPAGYYIAAGGGDSTVGVWRAPT